MSTLGNGNFFDTINLIIAEGYARQRKCGVAQLSYI